jgi:hypothetical protein
MKTPASCFTVLVFERTAMSSDASKAQLRKSIKLQAASSSAARSYEEKTDDGRSADETWRKGIVRIPKEEARHWMSQRY